MSLVYGAIAAICVEAVGSTALTWQSYSSGVQSPVRWAFRLMLWPLAGSVVMNLGAQADYIALGLTSSNYLLGTYFFAYRLALQLPSIIITSSRKIGISTLSGSSHQEYASTIRPVTTLSLLSCFGFAAAFPLLEAVLWQGRWADAILPGIYLAAAMPLFTVALYGDVLLQARSLYRFWTALSMGRATLLGIAAAWCGSTFQDVDEVALGMAVAVGLVSLGSTLAVLRRLGLSHLLLQRLVMDYVVWVAPTALVLALAGRSHGLDALPWPEALALLLAWATVALGIILTWHRQLITEFGAKVRAKGVGQDAARPSD